MTKQLLPSLRLLCLLTLLTGVAYPLFVTGMAHVAFPTQANGSMLERNGQALGSALIGQNVTDARYFWGRPSATHYSALPSGGSNYGLTSAAWHNAVSERAAALRQANALTPEAVIPADLLYASGSGLDPHISPDAARWQLARIAQARGLSEAQRAQLAALVEQAIEPPQWGIFGAARVNVLQLNLAVDRIQ